MLSPTIELTVHSVAWDTQPRNAKHGTSTLYVDCSQTMYFWFLPPWYRRAEVGLVVVLSLERSEINEDTARESIHGEDAESSDGEVRRAVIVDDVGYVGEKLAGSEREEVAGRQRKVKWFIAKQRDLYPPEELAQFALLMPGATSVIHSNH